MNRRAAAGVDLLSFAHPILINMANRPGRLQDSLYELRSATAQLVTADRDVHLIRPRRFTDAGGFASRGFRSNLDAHLQAATWARDSSMERVLVLEDDLSFGRRWHRYGSALLAALTERPWHIASLGYLDEWGEAPLAPDPVDGIEPTVGWARFTGKVNGAHAYFVHRSGLDAWIAHLQAVAVGRPGDDLRGPMPSDGALNTFAWVDRAHIRLLAVPNLVGTRPTRSDISPTIVDRLPLVGSGVEYLRRRRRRRHGSAVTNF